MAKALDAFRTISEVATELDVQKHVLRFWENKFPQVRPMKRGGGRRYYRPDDLDLLRGIRYLLHREGYTIKGVQKLLREQGLEFVKAAWQRGGPDQAAPVVSAKVVPGKPGRKPRKTIAKPDAVSAKSEETARSLKAIAAKRADQLATLEKLLAELEDCRRLLRAQPGAAQAESPGDGSRAAR
jgi:DNA-binding transcriptional MerR regulator